MKSVRLFLKKKQNKTKNAGVKCHQNYSTHTLEDTSLGAERQDSLHYPILTVTNRATVTGIRYVTGLTVYTVRIYSTKAILFKSMTTLVTLV